MSFSSRLQAAANWGLALALASGCAVDVEREPGSGDGESGSTVGGGGSGSSSTTSTASTSPSPAGVVSSAGVGGSTSNLPTTPYPDPIGCTGPVHDGGYYGQCCQTVGCTDPIGGACPESWHRYVGYPPGSGECSCGRDLGPFAPQHPESEGACCYLFGVIGCEGRPLVVADAVRLAPLIARSDWGLSGLLA